MEEIWKDIPGTDGQYQASTFGRIRSTDKPVWNGKGMAKHKGRVLKLGFNHKGYLCLQKCRNVPTQSVHRLIALTFIPNPDNKPQINHIDGNKQNNHVENLEWCTNGENAKHAYMIGLNHHSETSGRPKRKVNQIDIQTGKIIKTFNSIAEASYAMCKKKSSNIGGCCRHTHGMKTSFGYKWEFAE